LLVVIKLLTICYFTILRNWVSPTHTEKKEPPSCGFEKLRGEIDLFLQEDSFFEKSLLI